MVEIIPKKEKRVIKWEEILSSICILILLISLISIPTLILMEKRAKEKVQNLNEKIESTKPEELRKMEEELSKYQKKFKDFQNLIKDHYFPSNIFSFLEKNTHPQVFFTKFDFSLNDLKLLLSGTTENFVTLAQQISIFEESKIGEIELNQVLIDKDGKVNFDLGILLKKESLK